MKKFKVGDKLHFTGEVLGASEDDFVTVRAVSDEHYYLEDDYEIRKVPIEFVESSHVLLQ